MQAETCTACGTYRKIVNQEKDPLAEPLADDLASLMLDLLMSETPFNAPAPTRCCTWPRPRSRPTPAARTA